MDSPQPPHSRGIKPGVDRLLKNNWSSINGGGGTTITKRKQTSERHGRPPNNAVPVNLADVHTQTHTQKTHKHGGRLMLKTGLKSPSPPRLAECSNSGQSKPPLRPPPPTLHPPCTTSLLPPSTDFRTSAEICVTYVDSGLQRSQRESTVSTQRSLFLIFFV